MRISGCIITKNEENNIASCINSMKSIVDEIIVVDTGSEDDTIRIAEELGAFVFKHRWENDFSRARNSALEKAGGDWILFLDADERFHEDSIPRVRPIIEKVHPHRNIEGIKCGIIHLNEDTGGIVGNDEILRIFRKYKKLRYVNKIHEELRNNGAPVKCFNGRNELSIVHTGYSASIQRDKAIRNLELLKSNEGDEKVAYYLATTYFILNDYENAYQYAEAALAEEAVTADDRLAYKMHFLRIYITMRNEPSDKEKIRGLIGEANRKYGNHPEIAAVEAAFLLSEKLYGKALEKYLYALDCQKKYGKTFGQNNFAAMCDEVYCNIGRILYLMNREADAMEYYVKALRSNRYYPEAFNRLLALCGSLPENEVVAFVNSIYDMKKEADAGFVASWAADCGRPKIVLYYADKWNNVFGRQDDVLIYALTAQGKYPDALEIALLYLKADKEKYASLVTAVVILGRLFSEAESVKDEIGAEYFDLINRCAEGGELSEGGDDAFLAVLSRLVRHTEQYDINSYIQIYAKPEAETDLKIAGIFSDDYRFEQALYYSRRAFESSGDKEIKAAAAFHAGYCYHKLRQYEESADWLEKAILNGYKEPDAVELLRWNEESISAVSVCRH